MDYAMWNVPCSNERPQNSSNKSVNQIPYQGAKIAHSEMRSSIQQGSANSQNTNENHPNYQDMQKMDSTMRYGNDGSSHAPNGSFLPSNGNNNMYRNMGGNAVHSNNNNGNNNQLSSVGANSDSNSNGSHNQGSFGAQYNNSANGRAKSQATTASEANYCGNSNSPYSGWPGLNSTSVSSSNGWIIPNNISSMKIHDNSNSSGGKESLSKDCDENMSVDNEMSYTDLVGGGATGGSENGDEKQGPTDNRGNMPWGMQSRLGLLGGGENSVSAVSNAWSSNQGAPTSSATSSWENGHQISGASGDSGNNNSDMVVDNQSNFSGVIGAVGGSEYPEQTQNNSSGFKQDSHGMPTPPRLGLLGGGESSLNAPSAGWSTSATLNATGGTAWVGGNSRVTGGQADMSGNSSGMSPPKPLSSWAQAAGKGLNQNTNTGNGNGNNGGGTSGNGRSTGNSGPEGSTSAGSGSGGTEGSSGQAKSREELAAEIKVKAALSEGWGQLPINQDTPWDVPPSPPSSDMVAMKEPHGPQPPWRTPVNNGTDIWQNNLRLSKGVATPITTTAAAPPWGHTPASNIGGHWGEDDSTSSTWNSGHPQVGGGGSNWSEQNPGTPSAMWNTGSAAAATTPVEKHWPPGQAAATWDDGVTVPEDLSYGGAPVWNTPVAKQKSVGSWSPATTPKKENQPSGWELPSPPMNNRPASNYDDGTAVWGNPQRQGKVSHWKDMPSAKPIMNSVNNMGNSGLPPMSVGGSVPPTGPGMIRLPSGAAVACKSDMGSSMWNKTPSANRKPGWQEIPSHDAPNIGTWGEDPMHVSTPMGISGNSNAGGFGSGWSEQNASTSYWGSKPKGANSSWADGQVDTSSWLGPSKQRGDMMQDTLDEHLSGNAWPDSSSSKDSTTGYWNTESPNPSVPVAGWAGRKLKGGKPLTRDLIWASKQFRLLIEMGFKKEDAENALRNNNMNFDDALIELRTAASLDSNMVDVDGFHGRKVRPANVGEDISMTDNVLDPSFGGNFHASSGFQPGGNFQGLGNTGTFKPQVKVGPNASNLLNAALSGQNSNLSSLGNFNPALFQKLLPQQNPLQPFAALNNQSSRIGQSNFPSASQLRHLVQQIQMAVHAGFLNPQILQQTLAPQTLQLLFQLLQQIKVLQQLQQQQLLQNQHVPKPVAGGGPGNTSGLQLSVQLTQTKQRIVNLQNQIAAQQAVYLKQQVLQQQQPQQQHQSLHASQAPTDIFKPNVESVPSLQSDFRDLSLKDVPLQTHQQSRLNQWKLSSYDKDESNLCGQNANAGNNSSFSNEFIRAPGPLPSKTSSSASSSMPNPGPNLHPLLSQGDSAWSSLSRSQGDSGWPETATSLTGLADNAGTNSGSSSTQSSAIPPGGSSSNSGSSSSVENKEPSSTPPSSGPSTSSASHASYSFTDLVPEFEPGKPWKGTQLKNIEDDPHITPGSVTRSPLSVNTIKDPDLFWNSKASPSTTVGGGDTSSTLASSTWMFTPSNTTLSNSSSGAIGKSGGAKSNWNSLSSDSGCDVWGPSGSKSRGPPPGLTAQGWERQSNFVLLRNLTPQIDGSTLKTLCVQHGPLQVFHLSLNYGIALVRYSTREEASKAQSALNNCVLGNTTILADIPSDAEVQQYLALLTNQNAAGNLSWPTSQLNSNASSAGYRGGNSYPFSTSAGSSTNSSSKLDTSGWNGSGFGMPSSSSQLWNFPNTSSALWGSTQQVDHDSSTNASLNRFLPDDLLGGESM